MTDSGRWRTTSVGLGLKHAALGLLLAGPVLAVGLWQAEVPMVGPLIGLAAVAVGIDFIGRCLCLAAPVRPRGPVVGSVVSQAVGLIGGGLFAVTAAEVGWAVGLVFAGLLQATAAYLFTVFLADVARHLGRRRAEETADRLRAGVVKSLLAGSGFGLYALVVGAVVAVILLITCGVGWVVAVPAGAVALLPAVMVVLIVIGAMYRDYHSSLAGLGRAVRREASNPEPPPP